MEAESLPRFHYTRTGKKSKPNLEQQNSLNRENEINRVMYAPPAAVYPYVKPYRCKFRVCKPQDSSKIRQRRAARSHACQNPFLTTACLLRIFQRSEFSKR